MGSIGRRHCINLKKHVPDACLYFCRLNGKHDDFSQQFEAEVITSIEQAPNDIDAVFLCTPSYIRKEIYEEVFNRNIPLYIEKPIAASLSEINWLKAKMQTYTAPSLVGFNLRFLPVLNVIRDLLAANKLGSVCRALFEVGQYLPDWRPSINYREIYSAQKSMGGGVILDLFHEIDLAYYLFGQFSSALITSNKFSHLDIDVEDTAIILLQRSTGPLVAVNMDYIARKPIRMFRIVGDMATLSCDILGKKLIIEHSSSVDDILLDESFFDINSTYMCALEEFLSVIEKKVPSSYPLQDALQMHELILENIIQQ